MEGEGEYKNYHNEKKTNSSGDGKPWRINSSLFFISRITTFNTLSLDGGMNFVWSYNGASTSKSQRAQAQYTRDRFSTLLHFRFPYLIVSFSQSPFLNIPSILSSYFFLIFLTDVATDMIRLMDNKVDVQPYGEILHVFLYLLLFFWLFDCFHLFY